MTKFLELIAPLLDKLSWSKVAMVLVLVIIGIGGTALWENRQTIYEAAPRPDRFAGRNMTVLSDTSKEAVSQFLKKHSEVQFMTVLNMDFQKNLRTPIYRAFANPKIEAIVRGYEVEGRTGVTPIFLTDAVANNNQMVSLINGEFSCSPFADGQLARIMPDLKPMITLSCRVPIPPSWSTGTMGYIVVHLSQPTDRGTLEYLKLELMALSMFIFSSDVGGDKTVRMMP